MTHDHNTDQQHHLTPFSTYMKVAGGLFVLTFMTVGFHQLFHGSLEAYDFLAAPVAFSIAAVKAWLVMWWFMHLNHDKPLNRLTFSLGFFFLALLFIICAIDIWTRIPEHSVL